MIGSQNTCFVSLIRGKHFPRLIITWANMNQIPQHSGLQTGPGRSLPFQQPLSTLSHTLCSAESYMPTPTHSFIFTFVLCALSSWDTISWMSLCVPVYSEICDLVQSLPRILSFSALPRIFVFKRADHSLLWILLTGVYVLHPILLDHGLFENGARGMFQAVFST